jgi:superfamily II DNA/RNA helicase
MTPEQTSYYGDQQMVVAALMRKFERQGGWLSPLDQQRLLCAIQNMRMICDSTFLFDKETSNSTKMEELKEILHELVIEEQRKVVVFSEWERMTAMVGELLNKMKIGFVSLHGAIPTRRRGALIARFRDEPDLKVFLSTDAGGVGINLQAASAVINVEPPWNPARLEQRIARVHRMGQLRPVLVVHLLTENSIEERVWETIRLKKALFQGLFDGGSAEVSFEKLGRRSMMETLKQIVPETAVSTTEPEVQETDRRLSESSARSGPDNIDGAGRTLGALLEAGIKFLESFSSPGRAESREKSTHPTTAERSPGEQSQPHSDEAGQLTRNIQATIAPFIKKDSVVDQAALHIPLPPSLTAERIAQAIGAALSRLMLG